MISLCPPTFDITAPLVLSRTDASRLSSLSRRISRTPTLDGGAEITDSGYSEADRTFDVIHRRPSREEIEAARYLVRNYAALIIATPEGAFTGAIQATDHRDGQLVVTVLVTNKISA